jgi:hypothetical protein
MHPAFLFLGGSYALASLFLSLHAYQLFTF